MRGLSCAALLVAALPSLATALDWDSAAHEILIPTEAPELEESDPWYCAASNLTQFYDSRARSYYDDCASSFTGRDALINCNPDKDFCCQMTTTALPGGRSGFLEYGSSASSWWQAHSSDALELATLCPDNWYNAMFDLPAAEYWLNRTIIFGACYAEALQATPGPAVNEVSSATASETKTTTAVPGDSGADQVATTTPGPEPENGAVRRETGTWGVTAMAAAAVMYGVF